MFYIPTSTASFHVNMAWDQGKRANVIPSTLKPALWSTFLHGADGWR